jgi:hypothetical protein
MESMNHTIGDRAACDCGRLLIYTSEGWKHAGLGATSCVPHPVAMPIDDSDLDIYDPGIILPYHDAPGDEPDTSTELRENLADYAHEVWSGWMRWMFKEGGIRKEIEYENGRWATVWIMKPEKYDRWQRQMNTVYGALPEPEKESDRAEADKMIDIFKGHPDA